MRKINPAAGSLMKEWKFPCIMQQLKKHSSIVPFWFSAGSVPHMVLQQHTAFNVTASLRYLALLPNMRVNWFRPVVKQISKRQNLFLIPVFFLSSQK